MTEVYWLFYLASTHRVVVGAILAIVAVAIAFPLIRLHRPWIAGGVGMVAVGLFLANAVFASDAANRLVYEHGVTAVGRDVGKYNSYAKLNNHGPWLYDYLVVVTGPDGQPFRTRFRAYDSVLYPRLDTRVTSHDYPSRLGDVFNERYLPGHPDAFVIVTNDNSPWALAHRCFTFRNDAYTMKYRFDPDPTNPDYRPKYLAAIQAYLASGCITDQGEAARWRTTLQGLTSAPPQG